MSEHIISGLNMAETNKTDIKKSKIKEPFSQRSQDPSNAQSSDAIPKLRLKTSRFGEVTQGRLKRLAFIYACLFITGLAITFVQSAPEIGLSLLLPGGGLLHYATGDASMIIMHSALFLLVLFLFVVALLLWVAMGNLMAPILVYLASGIWAATMQHDQHIHSVSWASWFVPALVIVGLMGLFLVNRNKLKQELLSRDQLNEQLSGVYSAQTPLDEKQLPHVKELTKEELAFARFFYDRALQPVEGFEGFDKLDQFREAAFRYQIFYLSNSISLHKAACAPAMRAYHDTAQDNLMQKMLLHPVWNYWQIENIWGNFNWDRNPLPNDNVMYTGWYAAAMACFISNSGTTRYNAPGSLKLRDKNGEVAYETSFPELCATLYKNYKRSDYTLFACEPKFIYPICSGFGVIGLKVHDRLYGSDYWESIKDQYQHRLEEEFITVDGRVTAIRCYRTGLSVPGLTSAMADAAASFYLNGYLPGVARRSWEVARNSLLSMVNGKPVLKKSAWDKIDFGNYRPVPAATHGLFAMAAREMGDNEVADILLDDIHDTVEHEIVNGVKHFKGVSVGGHCTMFGATLGRVNSLHDMVSEGFPDAWKNGPMLEHAEYPEVLVAKAVSDGDALDLVLYPGTEQKQVHIEISQLKPNQAYLLDGILSQEIIADESGTMSLELTLDDRSPLTITPSASL